MKAVLDPKLLLTVAFLIAAVGILVYSASRNGAGEAINPFAILPPQEQAVAPDFTLPSTDGQTVTLSQAVKQGPVVLDFWASWCGPCHAEMPELEQLFQQFHGAGVQFYGVNSDDSANGIRQYVKTNGLTFPQLVDSQLQAHNGYAVDSLPWTLVIDKHMRVVVKNVGYDLNTREDLSSTLNKLLRG